jgi:hypothetical protein
MMHNQTDELTECHFIAPGTDPDDSLSGAAEAHKMALIRWQWANEPIRPIDGRIYKRARR